MTIKSRKVSFYGKTYLLIFDDEIVVDVWSGLGVYCGTILLLKKDRKLIDGLNEKSQRVFKIRKGV